MARNLHQTRNAQIAIACAVAAGTVSGDVVLVGSAGLTGFALTDRATTDTINAGTAPQGLADGQASVELTGISTAVRLTVAGGVALGAKVYKVTADGTYSGTATSNPLIGFALEAIADGQTGPVGLAR